MKKCPYCGSEMWWHDQCGISCLTTQLNRSDAKRTCMGSALCDFRNSIREDTFLSDEIRDAVLERLDTALMENEYEETT